MLRLVPPLLARLALFNHIRYLDLGRCAGYTSHREKGKRECKDGKHNHDLKSVCKSHVGLWRARRADGGGDGDRLPASLNSLYTLVVVDTQGNQKNVVYHVVQGDNVRCGCTWSQRLLDTPLTRPWDLDSSCLSR